MKWQATSPEALHARNWGDETVVYDAISGNTHLLEQRAALVLAAIVQAPADIAALARALPDLWPGLDDTQVHGELDAILAGLCGISLIAPATP